MGSQRVVKALTPQQFTNLTPSTVTGGRYDIGTLPLGNYKGSVAFFDLDKLVNKPLVQVEQQHILGILDGREEGYDLRTVVLPIASPAGTEVRGRITVPAGVVYYVSTVRIALPADNVGRPTGLWRCSLWTDRSATPDADGQSFQAAAQSDAGGLAANYDDEFHGAAPFFAITGKPVMLRLPAGSIITLQSGVINGALGAALTTTIQLYGFVTPKLVE